MSKSTRFTTPFRFKIAARLAIVLLCVSSSLVIGDISWAKKPTREEIRNLIERLDTNDEIERDKAIEELIEIREHGVPELAKAGLEHESLLVRIGVRKIFENLYEIPDELNIALENSDIKFRKRAFRLLHQIYQLGRIGFNSESQASKIIPKLIKLLDDKDVSIRIIAADTLGRIDEKLVSDEIIKALAKLLNDKESEVRSSAASALGNMGEKAVTDKVIKALTKLLDD